MKYFVILIVLLVLVSGCNLNKETYVKGKCLDGYEYNKEVCKDGKCNVIMYFADPCLNHECKTDSDCGTGGCSGEICGQKDKVKEIRTTCEFRSDYECLKFTSCLCIQGKCNFEENENYLGCLNKP